MSQITFEELKNKYQNKLSKDEEVTCKFIAKVKDGFLVDVNDEWEGIIPHSHIVNQLELESSSVGVKALVISGPDKSDRYTVSQKALRDRATWEKLENLRADGRPFKVAISKVIKGGVEVYIDSLRAFLPGRYLRLPGLSPENWINQEIDVLIEELDLKEKKIILNQKKAVDIGRQQKAEIVIKNLKEGDIVEAPVLRITDFGVFVDLNGLDGLIPASELSWGRFNHPKDVVKIGQVLQAIIFRVEKEQLRVALSVKQLLGDPWEHIEDELQIGVMVQGKVINEAPFGLFVELRPGVEALLHNTELNGDGSKPKVGLEVTARVIKIDPEQRKIGLSLKSIKQDNGNVKDETGSQQEKQEERQEQESKDESASTETSQEAPPETTQEVTQETTNNGTANGVSEVGQVSNETVLTGESKDN